jgi:CRISPR-associated protein Csb2
MLALRCEFLLGTYQAAAPGDVGRPEWPPHPARLHAALVAAGWALGGDVFPERARAALEWLEQAAPPLITARTDVRARGGPDVYVPRNLSPGEIKDVRGRLSRGDDPGRQMGRVSRRFPTVVPGDEAVWFVWREDPGEHVETLAWLAADIPYLGSSRSPVCCDVVTEAPEPSYSPANGHGTIALRAASRGFTAALLANRYAYPPPAAPALVPYREPGPPAPAGPEQASPFGELVVRRLAPSFPLTLLHTHLVTNAFRRAVLAQAGDGAPALLHGHDRNPHAAFLALPNVGHRAATGQIMGLGVAIPRDGDPKDVDAIIQAVHAVERLAVHRALEPSRLADPDPDSGLKTLMPSRWFGPARRWQTVTPVILDRFPKRNGNRGHAAGLREAVLISLRHAGVPEPVELSVSRAPWIPGALPAGAYEGRPPGLRVHVDLRFTEPVRGPILVGRGRYLGLGLFAPTGRDKGAREHG